MDQKLKQGLAKIYPIMHHLKVKSEKFAGGGPPDPLHR